MPENGLCAMTEPTALAVARNRAAVMAELRRLMPRMGEQRKPLPFGLAAIDSHLPDGGLACGALHEIVPAAEGCIAAAFGFIAAVLARISSPPPVGGVGVGVGRRSVRTRPLPIATRPPSPSGEGSISRSSSSCPPMGCAPTARTAGCMVMASTRSVSIRPA